MKYNSKTLIALCLVMFINSISQSLIIPIIPDLLLNYDYGLCAHFSLKMNNFIYGVCLSLPLIFALFSFPILGGLSDNYGRRIIILYGLIGVFISYFVSILAILFSSIWLFFLFRIIEGCFYGLYAVPYAAISDFSKCETDKVNNYRWISMSYLLGFILGPVIGGSVSFFYGLYSYLIPFILASIITLISLFIAYVYLQENSSAICAKSFRMNYSLLKLFNHTLTLLTASHTKKLLIQVFSLQFIMGLYIPALVLYLSQSQGLAPGEIGVLFMIVTLILIASNIWLQPYLLKRFKVKTIIKISLIFIITIFLYQGIIISLSVNSIVLLCYIVMTTALLYSFLIILSNSYTALISELCNKNKQGRVMSSIGQVSTFSAIPAGFLVGYFSPDHLSLLTLFSSLICIFILTFISNHPKK